jgi:hypothetical protein
MRTGGTQPSFSRERKRNQKHQAVG